MGAIFSPDGMTIQFDRGTVWHRILPQPVLHRGGQLVQLVSRTARSFDATYIFLSIDIDRLASFLA
jgi:hypothetical protein